LVSRMKNHKDQVSPGSKAFYEEYGRQWAEPLREAHEELCSQEKAEQWSRTLPDSLKGKPFIDFGCGNGVFVNNFPEVHRAQGIGVDISEEMINLARRKFPWRSFTLGGMDTLREAGIKADILFFNHVLEHVRDPQKYLVEGSELARFVGIRVPLEKTWLIACLNTLGLKERRSRLYYSEGHLYEFSKNEVREFILRSGMKIIAEVTVADSKKIAFHPYVVERLTRNKGTLGRLRYAIHRLLATLPYPIVREMLKPLKGETLLVLCERCENRL